MITKIDDFKNKINESFNDDIKTINENDSNSNTNYMVIGNINKMIRMLNEMTELLGNDNLDEWAKDHIATSADDIEEVYNFLKSKNESVNTQLPGMNKVLPTTAICWEPPHVRENNKPKIFTYTAYRLPTESEMVEIDAYNLNAQSIYDGYSYIIVGRGMMSQDNKQKIYNGIKALSEMFPENVEYSKALDMAKTNMNEGKTINELVTTNRDHCIVIVGDDVMGNGTFAEMQKLYDSIPAGARPSKYRSMYKIVAEDNYSSRP